MADQSNDPAKIFSDMLAGGQEMLRKFGARQTPADAAGATQLPPNVLEAAKQVVELQQQAWKQMADFWSGMFASNQASAPGAKSEDKRFAGEPWRNDPRFDAVRNAYLAYSGFLQQSVDSATVDDKTKARLRFAANQFADAMSPANFFATNPEAIQLAQETNGQSVVEGMRLFYEDLAKGRISMTDEAAFEVGKNLAVTPGQVIFENELIQLIQYTPATEQVYQRPLVMIPACINKFYILDLQPENSFVANAVAEGHTVFMVSWRNISAEVGTLTWDDYLQKGVIKAIEVALDVTGADRANTLGFCVGGTILTSALGVLAAKGEEKVSSLTLLTTMLDFAEPGEIGLLISEPSLAAREAMIGKGGVFEGKELAFTFSALRANDLIWQYVVNSYLKGKAPPAFDLLFWNSDSTNLPGPMMCWYMRNYYLENSLCVPDKTTQCGVPVDLGKIDAPAYLYASREDHIVPWTSAYLSRNLLGGDTRFVLGASGHIAGVINPPKKKKRNYWTSEATAPDAEQWLSSAQSVPGSWWPDWSKWLQQYAGPTVPKPDQPGNSRYKPIEPAPGRYVKAK
jgi:polyhydroxyalkanoate synthase subunit PhaC